MAPTPRPRLRLRGTRPVARRSTVAVAAAAAWRAGQADHSSGPRQPRTVAAAGHGRARSGRRRSLGARPWRGPTPTAPMMTPPSSTASTSCGSRSRRSRTPSTMGRTRCAPPPERSPTVGHAVVTIFAAAQPLLPPSPPSPTATVDACGPGHVGGLGGRPAVGGGGRRRALGPDCESTATAPSSPI